MILKNELISYQSYILKYIIDRSKFGFINRFIYTKRKLKKIINENIKDIIIDKKMIYDFIYSYFFHPSIKIDNAVPQIRNNICTLCVFNNDTELIISINEKQDVSNISVTYKDGKSIPKVINVNNNLIYRGDIEANRIIIDSFNDILRELIKYYLYMEIDIAFEEEKRGILKCIK